MLYILMRLPTDIYQLFPMAGLLGSLMGLGLLASRSELIVMRAAGISLINIARMVLVAAGITLIIAIIFGEIIAPIGMRVAEKYKADAISKGQTLHTDKGTWVRSQQDFIHIGGSSGQGQLKNITRYQFDASNKLIAVSFAKVAEYKNNSWVFNDVEETKINNDLQITTAQHKTQNWLLSIEPKLLGTTEIETNQKTLPQLFSYINYLHKNNLNADRYEFVMWQRFFQPLAALVMILLAVPIIFGPLRSVTMGLRMLIGAIVGIGFYMLNLFAGPIGMVFEFPILPAVCLPTILVFGLGVLLLVRAK